VQYNVVSTEFTGASQDVPALPYQSVQVNGTAQALTALTFGNLTIGNFGSGAVFDPVGFPITVTGQLQVQPGGLLQMTNAADSVDVGGYVSFAGDNSNGHLTVGTLVLRSGFVQNGGGNDSAFYATGTHRTIFTGGSSPLLGVSYAGTRFNRLIVRDTVDLQDGSLPLVVGDSLLLQQGTIYGVGANRLTALGPVIADAQSALFVDTLETYGTLSVPVDTNFGVITTRFFGTNQAIPSNLSYLNVDILGTVHPVAKFEAQDTLNVLAGNFDVNGQTVIADSLFQTAGTGTLKMSDPADTVIVFGPATFAGGSTTGLLTAGYFETPILRQNATGSTASFSASGSHLLAIVGNQTGGAEQIDFQSAGAAASHPQNLSLSGNQTVDLASNLFVADTFFYNVGDGVVNGAAGATVTVGGPLMINSFPNLFVDTLELRDPTPIQGSYAPGTWVPKVTRFAGINQVIRDTNSYHTVVITGSAHIS
ncbi:MAG: hypothetical protein ACREL2_07155, partial [Gemmatimonadales bacterium]